MRHDVNNRSSFKLLSTLLTEMDGLELTKKAFVIAATNCPEKLDLALIRPGRLDALVFVPPPNSEGRKQIFQIYTKKMPITDDVDFDILSEMTDYFTGILYNRYLITNF